MVRQGLPVRYHNGQKGWSVREKVEDGFIHSVGDPAVSNLDLTGLYFLAVRQDRREAEK